MYHELKEGDIVIAKYNNGYRITTDGWKGRITRDFHRAEYFEAEGLEIDEVYDDLYVDRFYIIYKD